MICVCAGGASEFSCVCVALSAAIIYDEMMTAVAVVY